MSLVSFHNPYKHQKTSGGFRCFQVCIGRDQWHKVGEPIRSQCTLFLPPENIGGRERMHMERICPPNDEENDMLYD